MSKKLEAMPDELTESLPWFCYRTSTANADLYVNAEKWDR